MSLTASEIHNILVFLERTQLTGKEVNEFCNVYQKLKQMQKETEEMENVSDG